MLPSYFNIDQFFAAITGRILVLTDEEGVILKANREAATLLQLSDPGGLAGRKWDDTFARLNPDACSFNILVNNSTNFINTEIHRKNQRFLLEIKLDELTARDQDRTRRYYLITCRKQQQDSWENMLYKVMQGTERVSGDNFLASLVRSLAQTLQVDYAYVGKLSPDSTSIRVLAFWQKDHFRQPFTYPLAGTPCEQVVNKKQKLIQANVRQKYPADKGLAGLGVESYFGTPVFYSNGRPLGLLVVMDSKPMADNPVSAYILNIFAGRAGVEIEWQETKNKLLQKDRKLQSVIDAIPHPIFYKDKEGRYEGVNKAFLEAVNLPEEAILGKKTIRFEDPDLPAKFDTELLDTPGQRIYESDQPALPEQLRHYMMTKSTIVNDRGEIEGIAGAAMDITELKQAERVVKANEVKYRTLFASANDAIFIMNKDVFIDCNPKTLEIFGCQTREDIIGHSPVEFSPEKQPDGRPSKEKALALIEAALAGKPQTFYWKHTRKSGEEFDAEVSLNAFDIEGETFIQAIVRNISDKMQLMRNMETQKQRLEEMNKFISSSDISFEQQLRIMLERATRSLGMDVGIIGLVKDNTYTIYDFFSEQEKLKKGQTFDLANTYCDITFKENRVVAIDHMSASKYKLHPCFKLFSMESYIAAPFWVRGQRYGTVSFLSRTANNRFQPIDLDYVQMLAQWVGSAIERAQYEEHLLERDALLETLLREMPIDFSVRDARLNMMLQSDLSKEYWGNNEGKPIDYSDVDEKTAEKWRDIFARVLQGEVVRGEDKLLIHGKPYHFYSIASPVKVYGKVTEVIVINIDISRLKETEQKLKEKNEQLTKLNEELDRFVYSASHDLRAPLASLLGLIDLTSREDNNEATTHYLELMQRSINTMDNFIADITNYSRNLRLGTSYEQIDFEKLFLESFEHVRFMMPGKAKYTIDIKGTAPFHNDYNRLKMVFNNLISNSIRYKAPGRTPHISLRVQLTPEKADIRLSDNGTGIDPKHIDKIFDMFYRASDTNTGSGLGLFIVKEIIEKLDGEIKVTSALNKGTTMHISLPNRQNTIKGQETGQQAKPATHT